MFFCELKHITLAFNLKLKSVQQIIVLTVSKRLLMYLWHAKNETKTLDATA